MLASKCRQRECGMKLKLALAAVTLAFGTAPAHSMEKMECCKDGKCACCAEKKDGDKPHEGMKH